MNTVYPFLVVEHKGNNNSLEGNASIRLILNLFLTGNFENVTIITHTRWASVGKVNFENTHPIIQTDQKNKIYSFMNGDIQNYEDLNSSKKNSYKSKSYSESDALALCNIFIEKNVDLASNLRVSESRIAKTKRQVDRSLRGIALANVKQNTSSLTENEKSLRTLVEGQ